MLWDIPLDVVKMWANNAPLIAALLAPASTLYDIPALSQRWYSLNGVEQTDPSASLILSAFSLSASITANALLILRFSIRWSKGWRWATRLSTFGWIIKTGIGMANLITFGALTRNTSGYAYLQGFWCAVLSVVISGLISGLLLAHYFLYFKQDPDPKTRFNGRAMLTSEMILFALLALNGLTFSKIEGWSYLEGIYFSVVALLSIGFGDFEPTHTSTKILLFPYVVTGIALLANQISIIVDATASRSAARRKAWRDRYAQRISEHEMWRDHLDNGSELEALQAEIRRLKKQGQAEEDMNELQELFFSACALITFWLLGALIYHFMEGWSYGNSLYFNYVFLFTIGFGDYYPVTPVGQVVFIIWALMAVPIMSNFVVQTIQTLVGHATRVLALATSQKKAEQRDIEKEYYETHASYLHLAIENLEGDKDAEKDLNDEIDEETERDPTTITVQKSLLLDLLSTATFMEAQARRIMVENMDKGSNSRLLLQADYNIQLYSMDKLGEKEHIRWLKQFEESMQKTSDLQWVKDYRKTYAKLLVIGTKLMNLEGDKSLAFQRTSSKVPLSDDSDGSNASSSEKTAKVHTRTADDDKSR